MVSESSVSMVFKICMYLRFYIKEVTGKQLSNKSTYRQDSGLSMHKEGAISLSLFSRNREVDLHVFGTFD